MVKKTSGQNKHWLEGGGVHFINLNITSTLHSSLTSSPPILAPQGALAVREFRNISDLGSEKFLNKFENQVNLQT